MLVSFLSFIIILFLFFYLGKDEPIFILGTSSLFFPMKKAARSTVSRLRFYSGWWLHLLIGNFQRKMNWCNMQNGHSPREQNMKVCCCFNSCCLLSADFIVFRNQTVLMFQNMPHWVEQLSVHNSASFAFRKCHQTTSSENRREYFSHQGIHQKLYF